MKNTGGTWDKTAWPTYFIASGVERLVHAAPVHDHLLVAINELSSEKAVQGVKDFIATGKHVLVDSGVFALSTEHAAAHGITMNEALATAPDKIDGFADLYKRYVSFCKEFGDRSWGYIEIDQGGRDNKIKTRTKLEALGLRPIPVYHPFNDGWDYFDFLAERYDRICFGNVVQADPGTRKRLVATAWERRRKYPHLWIHMLGQTPSDVTNAYPMNSCDSSSWLAGVRWGLRQVVIANKPGWRTGQIFNYMPGTDRDSDTGHIKAVRFSGYEAMMIKRTMHVMVDEFRETLGVDIGAFK